MRGDHLCALEAEISPDAPEQNKNAVVSALVLYMGVVGNSLHTVD